MQNGLILASNEKAGMGNGDQDHTGAEAEKFVQSMASRAITFLGDNDMSMEQKKSRFRRLLQDSFDMNTIGRFSLGRYWRTSTAAQQREYLSLFEDMIIDVYARRFSDYQGEGFETRGYRRDGRDTIVSSVIIPDRGSNVQVDWRVRYNNGRYRVIDVIVEGVSMAVTQRSDFSSVIQRGGGNVEVLLSHLRDKS